MSKVSGRSNTPQMKSYTDFKAHLKELSKGAKLTSIKVNKFFNSVEHFLANLPEEGTVQELNNIRASIDTLKKFSDGKEFNLVELPNFTQSIKDVFFSLIGKGTKKERWERISRGNCLFSPLLPARGKAHSKTL